MSGKVTIDNYPTGAYTKYAEDQSYFDPSLIEETDHLPSKTSIGVVSPIFQSKGDELFGLTEKMETWASFEEPAAFQTQSARFFGNTLFIDIHPDKLLDLLGDKTNRNFSKVFIQLFELILDLNLLLQSIRTSILQYSKG